MKRSALFVALLVLVLTTTMTTSPTFAGGDTPIASVLGKSYAFSCKEGSDNLSIRVKPISTIAVQGGDALDIEYTRGGASPEKHRAEPIANDCFVFTRQASNGTSRDITFCPFQNGGKGRLKASSGRLFECM